MFHFPDEVDWRPFFRFDKKWIEDMNWARISPAAKAVLPVIACHCNERGESFPGEETIAALSGLTTKSVRKGIHDLEGFPGFDWDYYLTRRGKRGKRFQVTFPPPRERGRVFFFSRGIMYGGIWSKLKPSARALYPIMRHFSHYVFDEDDGRVSVEHVCDFNEAYANRRYELCSAEVGQLIKHAGIHKSTQPDAIKSLRDNFLLEPDLDGSGNWKVFIIPTHYWRASYLNQRLRSEESVNVF